MGTAFDITVVVCLAVVLVIVILSSRVTRQILWQSLRHPFTKTTLVVKGGSVTAKPQTDADRAKSDPAVVIVTERPKPQSSAEIPNTEELLASGS
jgi:hypothetical protein